MQTKHTVKAEKRATKHIFLSFQAAVEVRHQPVYWMLLVTPTVPVIEVMEAILATEVWVVPVIHGHSFCLWPVRIIPPERINSLLSAQIMPFDTVPPSKPKERQLSLEECRKTWPVKHDHLNATSNCWEHVYGFFQSRQMRQKLAGTFPTGISRIWWLYLPSMS